MFAVVYDWGQIKGTNDRQSKRVGTAGDTPPPPKGEGCPLSPTSCTKKYALEGENITQKKVIKSYTGYEPPAEDGWKDVGMVPGRKLRNSYWRIFARRRDGVEGWIMIKIFSEEKVKHKANFWLDWNGERFAHRGDYIKMLENFPTMASRIKAFFPRSTKIKHFMEE